MWPGCRCARRAWSRSRSWSPSPRSGCCAWSSRRGWTRCWRVCARWEVRRDRDRRGHRRRGSLRVLCDGEVVGDMPVEALVDECPLYDLEPEPPAAAALPGAAAQRWRRDDPQEALLALLGSPNIASRPAAVRAVRLPRRLAHRAPSRAGRRRGAARCPTAAGASPLSIDGNGRRVACDPYRGTVEAVLECAANLACVGAEPLGLTNCLNFGNPEKPHVAWQLDAGGRRAGRRLPGARRAGGGRQRVALQRGRARGRSTPRRWSAWWAACPTPAAPRRTGFAREGDAVALVGCPFLPSLAGSELAKLRGEPLPSALPASGRRRRCARRDRRGARGRARGRLSSAHDIAEGGFAVALAECCLAGGIGARSTSARGATREELLFGEGPGGFVRLRPARGAGGAGRRGPATVFVCGNVGGERLTVAMQPAAIDCRAGAMREAHSRAWTAAADGGGARLRC